ncbi:MAG: riboflavin biosynthesis protein RibF [Clostridia bacterium]|nr:riboflavin biosynthesis protein RibF [Clostridia bacterium]
MAVYDLKTGREIEHIDLPVSVALGNFDGLHIGHRELIRQAKCSDNKCCVFTFRQNPFGSPRIIGIEKKLELLKNMGIDYACVYDFAEIKDMPYEIFLSDILVKELNCVKAVCGFNFRFGKNAEGDSKKLKEYMISCGREAVICDAVGYRGKTVSSSRIRDCLASGDIENANAMLGRAYSVDYHVSHGNKIGRKLGFPTVNQAYDPVSVKLPYGVYVCSCMGHPAITNFGVRPTVTDKNEPFFETYILDYDGDLYGEDISVDFHLMIRPEKKFSTYEELSRQIALDVEKTKEYFAK